MTSFTGSGVTAGEGFDSAPLSWVMGEIRESLGRSKAALADAFAQHADADASKVLLRRAKSQLHQVHGALQMVDVDGVAIVTETIEDMFDRLESGQLPWSAAIIGAVDHAYDALREYLEELLAGATPEPVRLLPYYQDLLQARGVERMHAADLFFPDLSIRPTLPPHRLAAGAASAGAADYVALRKRFEKALLPFLKGGAAGDGEPMHAVIAEVEQAQTTPQSRGFWWVMRGFAEAVSAGQIDNELYVKQLFARINLQMRRLGEGSTGIAERLLRDALFFIAGAAQPSTQLLQIRKAYRLTGPAPATVQPKRYGLIDADALAAARARLAQAKHYWNRIDGGDYGVAAAFEQELHHLAEAGGKLGKPPLTKLLRELNGIGRAAANAKPGDRLGLEMATSLLFVENALSQIANLPENFAESADGMTARLLSCISGEEAPATAPWLDDMVRQAQERQTIVALTGELQSSMRQVEKMLEEYFVKPADITPLTPVDAILHQVGGALAVLDQDDAARAVAQTQAALRAFAEAPSPPDAQSGQSAFRQIASTIGALGFFIETLQAQDEGQKSRFTFDEKTGLFQANLLERSVPPASVSAQAVLTPPPAFEMPTPAIEAAQAAEVAVESGAGATQDKAHARKPDEAQIEAPIETRIEARTETQAETPIESAHSDQEDGVDAELLEIFLTEAVEVLDAVRTTLPAARQAPHDQEHLTTLRRAFHTLKGSGRMVGLTEFGEAAWSIEQVLNLRLSASRGGDADLHGLIELALTDLSGWVDDLQVRGASACTAQPLMTAAERIKAGLPLEAGVAPIEPALTAGLQAEEKSEAEDKADVEVEAEAVAEIETPAAFESGPLPQAPVADDPEEHVLSDADLLLFQSSGGVATIDMLGEPEREPVARAAPVATAGAVIGFPTLQAPEVTRNDNIKQIGSIEISVALHNIYLAEADALVRLLSGDVDEWRHEVERPVSVVAVNAAHSLAGTSATVGFKPLQDIAQALEALLLQLGRAPVCLLPAEFDTLDQVVERVRFMLQLFALGELAEHEPQLVERLELLRAAVTARAAEPLAQSAPVSAPVSIPAMPVDEAPAFAALLSRESAGESDEAHEAHEAHESDKTDDMLAQAVLSGGEALLAATPLESAAMAEADEAVVSRAPVVAPALGSVFSLPDTLQPAEILPLSATALKDELDPDLLPVFVEEANDMLPQMGSVLRSWQQAPSDAAAPQALLRLLHTIKGSARMAGAMRLGQHMHEMESRIEQVMHGGAPSPQVMDDLLSRHDHGLQMFDALQGAPLGVPAPGNSSETLLSDVAGAAVAGVSGTTAAAATGTPAIAADPAAAMAQGRTVVPTAAAAAPQVTPDVTAADVPRLLSGGLPDRRRAPRAAPDAAMTGAPGVALVRVRADILDRLVNQAGEVSIARSKLETEIDTMRQSLVELTENVARLRLQLREVEMQAESQIENQISSQRENAADKQFDPLEFDRFTRLQELTRMMAESVNDVGSVHQNLARTLENASEDLGIQARLTRELQQDLMSVRMVQFGSITERLYRVTRQASKEIDKRVNLDIRGSTVEIDRSVLEKMAGPFEHLLRNAIVHGIESRAARVAAGKGEVGELLIEVRQDGNEVMIQFNDDGAGLDLERIRNKATQTGLLAAGAVVSDAELTDLIFHAGFSTAAEVTELAGRGIGMDVVRAEAAALGGRIAIVSAPGRGAQFTVHLPLTLAVTQVVLLTTGGRTFAVPSVLVEQVQQLKAPALAAAYEEGAVTWQSQRIPMVYLANLLGESGVTAVAQQYSPLVIVKSGANRIAVHVDEILGNREVVVKNVGPQLARLAGIAGATVLGSGEIVLILNPVSLAQRMTQEGGAGGGSALDNAGALPDAGTSASGGTALLQAASGPRTQHVVMVVDDSLTVRRVTQRLLSREGYQVVLAKDGVDALEQLQAITPDVMLVDIEMPRMDGFDLTRNIRGDERTRHIPIIMITSRTASKHRNYAFDLGVNEYLGKPFQEDVLLAAVTGFIARDSNMTPVA